MLGDILFEATIGQILTLYWWLRVKHGQAQLRRMKLKGRVQDIILQAYGLDRDEVLREAGWPMKTDVTPVTTDDPGGVELIR